MMTSELIRELTEAMTHYGEMPVRGFDWVRNHELKLHVCQYANGEFEVQLRLERPTRYGLYSAEGELVGIAE